MWVAGKLLATNSMLTNPAYRPALQPAIWLEHLRHYLHLMTCLAWDWPSWSIAVLFASLIAIAWISRQGAVRWAAVLIVVATLPVLPIDPRSYYVLYIAYLGWALFAAALLTRLPKPWLVTAAVAVLLVPLHLWATPRMMGDIIASENSVRPALEQLKAQHLHIPKSGKVLFLEDPFPDDDWLLTFILSLMHKDDTITVDRVKRMDHQPTESEWGNYNAVFRLKDDRLTRVR